MAVIEAARGTRALLPNTPGVESIKVVGLRDNKLTAERLADWLNISTNEQGFRRGVREALLVPAGPQVIVFAMVTVQDDEKAFSRKERMQGIPKAQQIGRLGKRESSKITHLVGERNVKAVIYVDVTPGLESIVEFRYFPEDLIDKPAPPPPTPDAHASPTSLAQHKSQG